MFGRVFLKRQEFCKQNNYGLLYLSKLKNCTDVYIPNFFTQEKERTIPSFPTPF